MLDTSVLLHDFDAIVNFKEHYVAIPITVLEELDKFKIGNDTKNFSAREVIRFIDKLSGSGSLQEWITLGKGLGKFKVVMDEQPTGLNAEKVYAMGKNDHKIINAALGLMELEQKRTVILVTKDINMRIKAKGSGLEHVEDYRHDRVLDDIDLLSTGYERFPGNFWSAIEQVDTVREDSLTLHRIPRAELPDVYSNQFVYDDEAFIAYVDHLADAHAYLAVDSHDHLMKQRFWGLAPRNLEQAMAMRLLDNDDVDMTVLTGPAGSGKTLLALAYGLYAILEQRKYNKLIVARSTPPMAEEIGFLPGTEEEKMAPWLAAFDDNLEILHGADESSNGSIEYVKERANIQFKSLNFMRGRSFNRAYIVIDEAQGLTQFQLKSIISRVGADSKLVVLGNLAQIDNKYISPLTSGLTYLVEKLKHYPHAGVMHVNGIVRSRLAAFAEENL